jgi:hypothetical protein
MAKTIVDYKMQLNNAELQKVNGGGLVLPTMPNIPYVTAPGDYPKETKKDEDRSGGVTYTW